MNIFFIEYTAKEMVKSHCDKHVVKMIVESAQLLSTASRLLGLEQGYKLSHVHHPDVKWLLESQYNWKWLRNFALLLCEEYTYRYNRRHKTEDVLLNLIAPEYEDIGFTEPPQCMPDIYKYPGDVVRGYRNYYIGAKSHIAVWTRRPVPEWYKEGIKWRKPSSSQS